MSPLQIALDLLPSFYWLVIAFIVWSVASVLRSK